VTAAAANFGTVTGAVQSISTQFHDGRVWDLRSWRQVALVSIPGVTGLAVASPDTLAVAASSGLLVIRVNRLATQYT
jgi:hypothetical protein